MKAPIEADVNMVAADAAWLPAGLDPATRQISFVHVPRRFHANVSFLTQQYLPSVAPAALTLPSDAVQQALAPAGVAPHFIFHSAFCCSTLLTRALDIPGISMGLKEPEILNELATLARQRRLEPEQLRLVARLLGRPFGAGEVVVVKPSNVANLLIPELMRAAPQSRALLLYAPLPRFLSSLARRGLWGRNWARKLFALLRRDSPINFGYSEAELFEQTDLQVAALAWLLHHAQFLGLLRSMPDRVRALDSESLLADRAGVLIRLADLFGCPLTKDACERIAAGPVFAEHAKEVGRSYDPAARAADQASAQSANKEEIATVCQWAEAVGRHVGVPLSLPPEHQLLA